MVEETEAKRGSREWVADSANGHSTTMGMAGGGGLDTLRAARAIAAPQNPSAGSLASLLAQRHPGSGSNNGNAGGPTGGRAGEKHPDDNSEDVVEYRNVSRAQFVGAQRTQVVMYVCCLLSFIWSFIWFVRSLVREGQVGGGWLCNAFILHAHIEPSAYLVVMCLSFWVWLWLAGICRESECDPSPSRVCLAWTSTKKASSTASAAKSSWVP